MSDLRELTITHLRGSTNSFALPFERGKKLTVIYGENGTGKSTICDAFEFLADGHVSSLDKRGLGAGVRGFWPSMGKTAADISVSLSTSAGSCRAVMSSKGDVIVTPPENRPRAVVFRKIQILSLIEATPGERYNAISRFIDVSPIEASEGTLRDLIRRLKENQKTSVALLEQSDEAIRSFWTNAGSPGKDPFRWAEEACVQGTETADAERAALSNLREVYGRLVEMPEKLRVAQKSVKDAEDSAKEAADRLETYLQESSKDAAEVVGILRAATAYLAKEPHPEACPLCESADSVSKLGSRVKERLDAFSLLDIAQVKVSAAKAEVARAQERLTMVRKTAREAVSRLEELREGTVAPAVETAGISQPVLRFGVGAQDSLEGNGIHRRLAVRASASSLSPERNGQGDNQQQPTQHGSASHGRCG